MIEVIKTIHERKKAARIHPDHVLLMEIYRETGKPLNELKKELKPFIKDKTILWGHTINDFYFKINTNGKSKD